MGEAGARALCEVGHAERCEERQRFRQQHSTYVSVFGPVEKRRCDRRVGIRSRFHQAVTMQEPQRDEGIEKIAHVSGTRLQSRVTLDLTGALSVLTKKREQPELDG